MSFSRAIIQQPSKFFVENRRKLFEEHDKEYGTKEPGEWTFEGTETLYKGLFNLVGSVSKGSDFTFTLLPGQPHGRVDPLKGDGDCHQVCRAVEVVQTYLINPIHASLFGSKFSRGGHICPPPTNNGKLSWNLISYRD